MNFLRSKSEPQKTYNPWLIAVAVSLATFMEVLDTTITNVSLSHIAGSLSASRDESTWVLTSYLVANGIILPLSGWLSGVLGRKRFFMICIAGFTISSFLCGIAQSLPMLIIFRLIQGLAGGGLQPTQQAIIMDSFPPEKRGAVFAVTGITMIVAPVMGPTLGGWITDNFSWRWIFYINIPVGLLALSLVAAMLRDPEHAKSKGLGKIDFIGLILVVIGLGALQIVLDKGQQEDWFESNFIISMAIICGASLIGAISWLIRQADPIVDLSLMKDRSFSIGTFLIFITGFVLYSSSALLPILVQSEFGYDALMAGLVLSPAALVVLFLMPVSGRLVAKIPARYLVLFGMSMCAVGCFLSSHYINSELSYSNFVFMRAVQMMGIPFLFIPISTLAFMNVPKEKSTKASSLFSLARNIGGSVGIALITTYLARQSQVHQSYLSEHVSAGSMNFMNAYNRILSESLAHGLAAFEASKNATAQLYQALLKQSSLLAYADSFFIMGLLLLVGICCAFFLPLNKRQATNAADAPPAH